MRSPRSLVDWASAGYLDNGFHAVLAVEENGETWPWLLAPDQIGGTVTHFPGHELTGPLPAVHRERASRCNGPTRAGWPCQRIGTSRHGGRCAQHRAVASG